MVDTSLGSTHIIISGEEDAPPLLLLHGASSNSAGWMGDAGTWSKDFRLIAADMPGEPGMSCDRRLDVAGDDYIFWLESLLDSVGYGSVSIIGMSLGSFAALKFATVRPERVKKLSMLTTSGFVPARLSFMFKALPLMFLGDWGSDRVNKIVAHKTPMPIEAIEFGRLVSKHYKPMMTPIPLFTDDELKRLTMPVQYFGGNKDALIDSEATALRLRAQVPHAEVNLLPDTGHLVLGQTEKILGFMKG